MSERHGGRAQVLPRLDQDDAPGRVFAQAGGENAAGRAAADNQDIRIDHEPSFRLPDG